MEENEREVLTDMLLQMDRFDLYGKLAIPKKHDFATEVPELYRLCAESRGVFVNPALVEPFGLTLIEASACGLPIVATNDGGPVDIVTNCDNGILVDVQQAPRRSAKPSSRSWSMSELWDRVFQQRRHRDSQSLFLAIALPEVMQEAGEVFPDSCCR